MPTQESDQVRVLQALLGAGDVTMYPEPVWEPGFRKVRGFRLVVNSSVVIDGQHAQTIRDACGIAIDDSVVENDGQ